MTEALELAGDFIGGNFRTVTSGSGGYMFINSSTDAAGNTVNRIVHVEYFDGHYYLAESEVSLVLRFAT
ncbi:hypothetical protein [Actinocrinis sp.]|uniref:hypothetical protein n=1 Tax=Actinocrinis sp. TaxID=1920516 RepID=UPI002D35BB3E|nr:hypothetical protein [Actinocrinis sp.]HZP49588.1 hypothetical protein [Actinocrinis sp.]